MIEDLKPLFGRLTNFAKDRLGFEKPPRLFLKQDSNNGSAMLGKTAHYDPQRMSVTVFVSNRHPKDILRSFCHELVHHCQNLRGDLAPEKMKTLNNKYAQENEHMRKMEEEAYLQGNMCFRDWEDGLDDKLQYKMSIAEQKFLKENKDMSVKISKSILKEVISRLLGDKINENEDESLKGKLKDKGGESAVSYYNHLKRESSKKKAKGNHLGDKAKGWASQFLKGDSFAKDDLADWKGKQTSAVAGKESSADVKEQQTRQGPESTVGLSQNLINLDKVVVTIITPRAMRGQEPGNYELSPSRNLYGEEVAEAAKKLHRFLKGVARCHKNRVQHKDLCKKKEALLKKQGALKEFFTAIQEYKRGRPGPNIGGAQDLDAANALISNAEKLTASVGGSWGIDLTDTMVAPNPAQLQREQDVSGAQSECEEKGGVWNDEKGSCNQDSEDTRVDSGPISETYWTQEGDCGCTDLDGSLEREENLYEARFTPRNNELFKKLMKKWVK